MLQSKFPYEPWTITENGFMLKDLRENESAFALGNGFIGMRGNLEENTAGGAETIQGTFINGVFDSEPIIYGETAYGYAKNHETRTTVLARKAEEALKIDYYEGRISGLSYLLKAAVRDKNLETVGNIVSEFCNGIRRKQYFSLYELQIYTTEINLLLRKIMMESREVDSFTVRQISLWIYDLDVWEESVKNAFYEIASCHFGTTANITAVYAYIQENFGGNLSIPALSSQFNMSPQYLSKLFKNYYKKTIGQMVTAVRIEKAKECLRHGTATISEIAHLTGYEDENYFG